MRLLVVPGRSTFLLLPALVLAGCPGPLEPPRDGGRDAPVPGDDASTDVGTPDDAGMTDTNGTDAGMDDSGISDGGTDAGVDGGMVMPGETVATPAPTITRSGTGGVLLIGNVLTPTGPLDGEVLIVGNQITCVAASCAGSPMAGTVTVVDTHGGTISPGLLDAHDHLSYDFIGEWVPPAGTLFDSRYEWRGNDLYSDWVSAEGYGSNDAICPGSKWGELRSIIHGTTTVQGQSQAGSACTNLLARNADTYHGLEDDFMRVTISGPCESGFPARPGLVTDFGDGDARRFVVHVGEGVRPHGTPGSSSDPTREFDCYAGRTLPAGTPNLIEDAAGNPYETAVMIHAVPLTPDQIEESVMNNVRFVWSPSSNIVLYADTAPIEEMLDAGLTVALANDWTVSGTDEMLSEMRYAHAYGEAMSIDALTPRRLWEMMTMDAAEVLGLTEHVGTIEVGQVADIAVFSRTGDDPYQAVMESRARDVTLTLIGGEAYYGVLAAEELAVNGDCEPLDVCGSERFLCVQNVPATEGTGTTTGSDQTMEMIEAELNRILDENAAAEAPAVTATEVLPLVDCSL